MASMLGFPLWVSPIRDVHGFFRRYIIAGVVVALTSVALSLVADGIGNYYLCSRLQPYCQPPLCNFSIVARAMFAFFNLGADDDCWSGHSWLGSSSL